MDNQSINLHETPFRGLSPYLEKDAPFFFGREKEQQTIVNNLISCSLTVLYGSSGAGKTSVLRAGVAYHLQQEAKQNWANYGTPKFAVVVFNSWHDNPLTGLMKQVETDINKLYKEVRDLAKISWTTGWGIAPVRAELKFKAVQFVGSRLLKDYTLEPAVQSNKLYETLQKWTELIGEKDEKGKLIARGKLFVILDQFEEYLLYHPDETGEGTFFAEFPRAVNQPNVNFLISIREDSIPKLRKRFKVSIQGLFNNYLRLENLNAESAYELIVKTIDKYNENEQVSISIEENLPKIVIPEVSEPVALESGQGKQLSAPFLQIVMSGLWEEQVNAGSRCSQLKILPVTVKNIVAEHLNKTLKSLNEDEKKAAANVFQHLVTPSGKKIALPVLDLVKLTGHSEKELNNLLQKLSSGTRRIIRSGVPSPSKPNVEHYEVFHDSLAQPIHDWQKQYLLDKEKQGTSEVEVKNSSCMVMVNQNHVYILKQGVEVWNKWRNKNPDKVPDLRKANLRKANLRSANLMGADLRSAILVDADLRDVNMWSADLESADLKCADLRGTTLVDAKLRSTILSEVNLSGMDLSRVNLSEVNLSSAILVDAKLMSATLRGADLRGINLMDANLVDASLERADLRNAILVDANLRNAILVDANLRDANLRGANLRGANLRGANLRGANLRSTNLRSTDLSGVNLSRQNLSERDFSGQNLVRANLSEVNFSRTQVLGTNFQGATLTGACIQDWNINSETNLENVICDYIYLKSNRNEGTQQYDFSERRPANSNRNFEPGEFAKLVEQSIHTVDLIFNKGIDWQSFLTAFQELQIESESGELSIRAIEKKRDGAFVIRVDSPAGANKEKIEASFWSKYQPLLEAKDEKIKLLAEQKDFYSQQVENIRKDNTRLIGIVETMAEKETSKVNMTFHAPVTGVAGNVEGNQNIYASEQKQTLAEAADEIQKLLQQLEQTNPTATVEQQKAYVDAAIPPTLKQRCVGALKAGGETAIEEFLDNPYVNVGKAVVKGWMKPE